LGTWVKSRRRSADIEDDMDANRPLEPHTLDQILRSTLEVHPGAALSAAGEDGLFVPMPDSIPMGGRAVLEGRWPLDLVGAADAVKMIETWGRAQQTGVAHEKMHLKGTPPVPVDLYFIDARHSHGVFLVIAAPTERGAEAEPLPLPAPMPLRVAKIFKDDLSVITAIDAAATQILGWESDEIVGRRSIELVHPDDQERAILNWLEMLDDPSVPRPVRFRHQRKDLGWTWLEVTNHFQTVGSVMADVVDITEEMAAQDALREREQLLDRLAETVPLGLFQVDCDRRIVYANERLAGIVGTTTGDTVADRFAHVVAEDQPVLDANLTDVLTLGHHAEIELRLDLGSAAGIRQCALSIRPLGGGADEAVSGAIASVSDVTESVRLRRELERRATFDPLTGCRNRASVMADLDAALAAPGHRSAGTAAIFVDLDRFKPINDRLGHTAGDRVLEIAATRLKAVVRDGDIVGRFGGDEFLLLLTGVSEVSEALEVAGRVANVLHKQVTLPGGSVDMRASVGVAWSCQPGLTAGELVAEADTAMYESKRQGAGRPVLFGSSLPMVAGSGLEDERWLRDALAKDLLEVHYQPIVDLDDGRTIGYESLVRGRRDGRLVVAGDFIELAERTGLIHDIGVLVLERTVAQAAAQGAAADGLHWAVNASSLEIAAPGFTATVERCLTRHGVRPEQLIIEVTEHSSLGDSDQARTALRELDELGVLIALDDFGTGFSSLALLRTLPVSIVKIDRTFTAAITNDTRSRQLVDATIEMARRLDLTTVIEGVETEDQRELLLSLGGLRAQGWLFSPALPPAELFASGELADARS
jgi:diguanylate cyclase (GGDEF)-like protein/PAS domain S-box-containing protein